LWLKIKPYIFFNTLQIIESDWKGIKDIGFRKKCPNWMCSGRILHKNRLFWLIIVRKWKKWLFIMIN